MKSCFFIGHREASEEIFPELAEAVERHIVDYGVTEFIVGNYGGFDRMAARAVISAKALHSVYGEYTYTWYVVPYGKYEVVNNSRLATVFVVSDKDSNDVRCTLQFQSSGETGEIVVEEGTHIELSMNAEVILTAK